jgi:hypothetical protein
VSFYQRLTAPLPLKDHSQGDEFVLSSGSGMRDKPHSMPIRRLLWVLLCLSRLSSAAPEDYFGIQVVDETTGRGVPLVTLRTTNQIMP